MKNFVIILLSVFILVLVGMSFYFWQNKDGDLVEKEIVKTNDETTIKNAIDLEETNKTIEKRKSFELKLAVDNDNFYSSKIESEAYIFENNILKIYTGEKLFIEADVENNKIIKLKVVDNIVDENKTFEIKLVQVVEDKKSKGTRLEIKNPFDKDLIYEALINPIFEDDYFDTSTVPVRANLRSFEIWSETLTSVVLKNLELKDTKIK